VPSSTDIRRTCLVTGAGRGIGHTIAVALAAQGHRVAVTARSADELAQTADRCDEAAGNAGALAIPADLTAPGAVDALFAEVEAAYGPVEILVANAGAAVSASLVRTSDEDWQRMLDINLTAPFRCMRRALPTMIDRQYGRIIVIASVSSKVGAPYISAYAASKHGVLGLVRSAAAELARTGVTVNAICPGFADTPMTDTSVANIARRTGRDEATARRELESRQPIDRLITVDEIASAVMFCVTNPAITGQGINVDGGTVQS
jgi:NAD(P)-dependent dehydrogenase (short-subunit alcohol dehydrogenase family)